MREEPLNTPVTQQACQDLVDTLPGAALLVSRHRQIKAANAQSLRELDEHHALQRMGDQLRARDPSDVVPLHRACDTATRLGKRVKFRLGGRARSLLVQLTPWPTQPSVGEERLLLVQWWCHSPPAPPRR